MFVDRTQVTVDQLIEMAKDLLMIDTATLLEKFDAARNVGMQCPVLFGSDAKETAFYRMLVALHAARGAADEYRKAHVADMDREWHRAVSDVLDQEEINRRRAS